MRPGRPAGGQDDAEAVRAVPTAARIAGFLSASGLARVAVVAGAAGAALLLALAAGTPTSFVGTGGGTGSHPSPSVTASASAPPRPLATRPPHLAPVTGHPGVAVLGTVLLVLLALLLLALVAVAAWALWRRRPQPPQPDQKPEPEWQPLPDLPASIRADAQTQEQLLATGAPRNAIVACWVRLQDLCAEAGMRPEPAETSAELTARVLARAGQDGPAAARDVAGPITQLAALYREARFSTHPMGEPARAAAREALRKLYQQLEPPVPQP